LNSPFRELYLDDQAELEEVSWRRSTSYKDALTNRSGWHVLNVRDSIILCLLHRFGLMNFDLLSAQPRTESLLGGCFDGQGSGSFCFGVSCLHAQWRGPAGVMKALGSRLAFCVVFLVDLKLDWKLSFSSFWLRLKGVFGALLAGVFACWFNGFAAAAA
jgi:hypothetical protein